jgi:hypothetical protein
MRLEHGWLTTEMETGPPSSTRRSVLAGSLKLAAAGALALTLANGSGRTSLVLAQDDSTPEAGAGEVEGGIQVGTTDDTAAGAQVEGEATADDQTREERRAGRDDEEGVGAAVGAVPSTGVGTALGSSLSGVVGAIGVAAATGAAALLTRRQAESTESAE